MLADKIAIYEGAARLVEGSFQAKTPTLSISNVLQAKLPYMKGLHDRFFDRAHAGRFCQAAAACPVGMADSMTQIYEFAAKLRSGQWLFGYYPADTTPALNPDDPGLVGVWRALNPLRADCALVSRSGEPMRWDPHRARAADIACRTALLADFDANCESDMMSTDCEHSACIAQADECSNWFVSLGCPRPKQIDSGRGCQLHIPVELPADKDADALARRFLLALKQRYSRIDVGMFDRGRLARLPNFWNRKSAVPTPERPWRMARLRHPGDETTVTAAQISAVCDLLHIPATRTNARPGRTIPGTIERKIRLVERWAAEVGFPEILFVKDPDAEGAVTVVLDHCPRDESHTGTSAALVFFPDGGWMPACFHNSCKSRSRAEWWADVQVRLGRKISFERSLFRK